MISINTSSALDNLFNKPEEETVFIGKLVLGGSFMNFVTWLKHNQSIVNFTEDLFIINMAYVTDQELQDLIKNMCEFTGRTLSFYFNDLDNQWILNYKPYLNDILPIIEAILP